MCQRRIEGTILSGGEEKEQSAEEVFMAPISFFGIDWSPDGGKLVFVSDRDGDDDVYVAEFVTRS